MTSQTCPICGKYLSAGADPSAFPFCSARCRQIDLGRWFSERYRIVSPLVNSPNSEDGREPHPASGKREERKIGHT